MKLSIESRVIGRREILLVLRGEVDYASAQDLRSAISTALAGQIDLLVISLAEVTFLDSTGIGTLVVARRICAGVRVMLEVRDASPFLTRLFEVVGVADALGVSGPADALGVSGPAGAPTRPGGPAGALRRRIPEPRVETEPQPA